MKLHASQSIKRAAERIDAMSVRERVLVFGALLAALVLLWWELAMAPVFVAEKRTLDEIRSARQRIEAADAALHAQASSLARDGTNGLSARLDQAQRRSGEIDAQIAARASKLIDPASMAEVLEDVLATKRGLRLLRARNLDAQRLGDGEASVPLYRHTLRLELEGPYLAVLEYLQDIEALPWRFYWQNIEIDSDEYPRNRVRIDVSTLSLDEDWIGV